MTSTSIQTWRSIPSALLLSVAAVSCAKSATTVASSPKPEKAAPEGGQAAVATYPAVQFRAAASEGIVAELRSKDLGAWVMLSASGDDLYAFAFVFRDTRPGRELSPAMCRVNADWMRAEVGSSQPSLAIDPAGCDRPARDVVTVPSGEPQMPDGWGLRSDSSGGTVVTMGPHLSPETYIFGLVKGDKDKHPLSRAPAGYSAKIVGGGMGIRLTVP